ncbi:MAG: hypothetical protein M3071_19640 [Actinomycetota bacterium]|nr:hypothetical protein [Actinomycetota bacterium]
MAPDRERYAERQAGLLRALRDPAHAPDGFAAADLAAASGSLVRKRARQVAASWPAVAHALGEAYLSRFERFARTTPPPAVGDGLGDGLAFAGTLDDRERTDEVRAETMLARGLFTLRHGTAARRRGPYLAAVRLGDPHRILVVAHLPGVGRYHAAIRIPGSRRERY